MPVVTEKILSEIKQKYVNENQYFSERCLSCGFNREHYNKKENDTLIQNCISVHKSLSQLDKNSLSSMDICKKTVDVYVNSIINEINSKTKNKRQESWLLINQYCAQLKNIGGYVTKFYNNECFECPLSKKHVSKIMKEQNKEKQDTLKHYSYYSNHKSFFAKTKEPEDKLNKHKLERIAELSRVVPKKEQRKAIFNDCIKQHHECFEKLRKQRHINKSEVNYAIND